MGNKVKREKEPEWVRYRDMIEEMIDSGDFDWAEDTLEGIYDWVDDHQHITDGQMLAIDNIASKVD